MRGMKVFNLVRYLKSSVEFYHDTLDLEEDIREVLKAYGIYDDFTDEEAQELRQELSELAEENELREAVRLVSEREFSDDTRMIDES